MRMSKLALLIAELLHAGARADETGLTMYVYEEEFRWHTTAIPRADETTIAIWPGGATSVVCDLCEGRNIDAETKTEDPK